MGCSAIGIPLDERVTFSAFAKATRLLRGEGVTVAAAAATVPPLLPVALLLLLPALLPLPAAATVLVPVVEEVEEEEEEEVEEEADDDNDDVFSEPFLTISPEAVESGAGGDTVLFGGRATHVRQDAVEGICPPATLRTSGRPVSTSPCSTSSMQ